MSSSRRERLTSQVRPRDDDLYFLITVTNCPTLLERTRQYQQPHDARCQANMLVPYVLNHLGVTHSDSYERLLYNTMRGELERMLRVYLRRTERRHPISLVFDLSSMEW